MFPHVELMVKFSSGFNLDSALFVWNFHESHDRVFSFLQIGLEDLFDVACAFIRVNF